MLNLCIVPVGEWEFFMDNYITSESSGERLPGEWGRCGGELGPELILSRARYD